MTVMVNGVLPQIIGLDGWTTPNETWTYASATTITIPSGGASRYQKGDRLKFTQTTVKYFYVVGVADTVLTLTGGSDYSVANAAITANFFSHQANPVGFPTSFNFTPGWTGFAANPTVTVATFSILGNLITIQFVPNTDGTSNATTFTMTGLPVGTASAESLLNIAYYRDNGTLGVTSARVDIATTVLSFYTTTSGVGWTAVNAKSVQAFTLTYAY